MSDYPDPALLDDRQLAMIARLAAAHAELQARADAKDRRGFTPAWDRLLAARAEVDEEYARLVAEQRDLRERGWDMLDQADATPRAQQQLRERLIAGHDELSGQGSQLLNVSVSLACALGDAQIITPPWIDDDLDTLSEPELRALERYYALRHRQLENLSVDDVWPAPGEQTGEGIRRVRLPAWLDDYSPRRARQVSRKLERIDKDAQLRGAHQRCGVCAGPFSDQTVTVDGDERGAAVDALCETCSDLVARVGSPDRARALATYLEKRAPLG